MSTARRADLPGDRRVRHRLPRGSDGRRLRASFEAHLAGCPHCTAYLEQMRAMIRVAGTIEAEDAHAGVPGRAGRARSETGGRHEGSSLAARARGRVRSLPSAAMAAPAAPVTKLKARAASATCSPGATGRRSTTGRSRSRPAGRSAAPARAPRSGRRCSCARRPRCRSTSPASAARSASSAARREAPGHPQRPAGLHVRPRGPGRSPLRQRRRLVRRAPLKPSAAAADMAGAAATRCMASDGDAKRARGEASGGQCLDAEKVHRAGGAFIHRFRWLSDWALRPSPYNPRKRLRLTRAPCSVQAATYGTRPGRYKSPREAEVRKERKLLSVDRLLLLLCDHGRQRVVP